MMTTYSFSNAAETTIAFDPVIDVLEFTIGYPANRLSFREDGGDLIVDVAGTFVRLASCSLAAVTGANFLFDDGGVVRFDTAGADTLTGGAQSDYLDVRCGGDDMVSAGDGDDRVWAAARCPPTIGSTAEWDMATNSF